MAQVCQHLGVLLAVAILAGGRLTAPAAAADLDAEAARLGLVDTLEDAVNRAAASLPDELDLPPSISETVRRVAFVNVDTVKEAKNMKFVGLPSLRSAGTIGVDPVVEGKKATFTLPLQLLAPRVSGDLVRKVNDVGPTGHFNTTFSEYRVEAEGAATVGLNASCEYMFTDVKLIDIGQVHTEVEGASLLNRVLAKDMSDAVRAGTIAIREPVTRAILGALQAAQSAQPDCGPAVNKRLASAAPTSTPAA